MTADRSPEGGALPAEMPLLFFHAAGVALGVEAAAVEGIIDAEQARQAAIACGNLDELPGAGGASSPAPAKVLLFKGHGDLRGMGIDSLDEIVTVPTTALQPLPEPLSYFGGPRAFWGCIVRADKVVLLVDADRFRLPAPAARELLELVNGKTQKRAGC